LLIFLLIYLYCLFLFSLELFTGANLHMAHLMPLPLTVSSLSCFSKIQIGFTFLVPAHPGSPDKKVVKWVFVCVRIQLFIIVCYITCQQCPLLVCQCSLSWLVSHRLADRCGHFLMSWEVSLDNSVNGDNQSQLNSSMHHYECVALCKDISLQWGWFCTGSLSSCIPRSSEDRSSWMFFIQVVRGRPGGRLQFSGGGSKMAWLASAFSSIRSRCPEKVRWWDLMMDESGWLIGNVGISEWW